MAPLLYCRKHALLRPSTSWKCLCRCVSSLREGSWSNWCDSQPEPTRAGDKFELAESSDGTCSVAGQGGSPRVGVVEDLYKTFVDSSDLCIERSDSRSLMRKGSLGSLTGKSFSTCQQEQISSSRTLRRSYSGLESGHTGGELGADKKAKVGSSISVNKGNDAETFFSLAKNINRILSGADWEGELEQLDVQFSIPLVTEVLKRQPNVMHANNFFNWVKEKRNFHHNSPTYKVLLHSFINSRIPREAKLTRMKNLLDQCEADGVSPGVTIHSFVVNEYCMNGNVEAAVEHVRLMRERGCLPNVVTYSTLIKGFTRLQKIGSALKVLKLMEMDQCEPNVVTYTELIYGLMQKKRFKDAWSLFERMKVKGCLPNMITYSCMVDGLAKAGHFEEISDLLNEMRRGDCKPNSFIYGTLINHCVKVGTLERAWDLFAKMKEDGLTPNLFIFTPLVASLGKAGDWEQAQRALVEMRALGCYPDHITYSALIAGLVKSGKWENACSVLEEMYRYRCTPNEKTYIPLIDGLVKVGEVTRAAALLEEMKAKGLKPSVAICRTVSSAF